MASTALDREMMELAMLCEESGARVGVVITKNGAMLAQAYKGEPDTTGHAEAVALGKVQGSGGSVAGATVYVTLEPCSHRPGKQSVPCATLLISANVATVFIGSYDRNPSIYRMGWNQLSDDADSPYWTTTWTERGSDSIHAYGGRPGVVALAKYAESFDEALELAGVAVSTNPGECGRVRLTSGDRS